MFWFVHTLSFTSQGYKQAYSHQNTLLNSYIMYTIDKKKTSCMFWVLDIDVILDDDAGNTTHAYLHLLTSVDGDGDGELPN